MFPVFMYIYVTFNFIRSSYCSARSVTVTIPYVTFILVLIDFSDTFIYKQWKKLFLYSHLNVMR